MKISTVLSLLCILSLLSCGKHNETKPDTQTNELSPIVHKWRIFKLTQTYPSIPGASSEEGSDNGSAYYDFKADGTFKDLPIYDQTYIHSGKYTIKQDSLLMSIDPSNDNSQEATACKLAFSAHKDSLTLSYNIQGKFSPAKCIMSLKRID